LHWLRMTLFSKRYCTEPTKMSDSYAKHDCELNLQLSAHERKDS
jgi:hypothetical protein